MFRRCIQINLQQGLGGGEVYAASFARTVAALGIESVLIVHPQALGWSQLRLDGVRLETPHTLDNLPGPVAWIVCHHRVAPELVKAWKKNGHFVTSFAHMPLYGRDPAPLRAYDLVIPVSGHVLASLRAAGIEAVYPEPMYGVAELARSGDGPILGRSRYDWDRRKLRDRLLGTIEPLWRRLLPRREFQRRPGITLGIVSRLTPIKQFPLLFQHLAPVLARHPHVNLEIFGSGGYASVRDLDRALAPIRSRARFWGHQEDVAAVYRQIDALLAGLPEKEALGLNIIEAQACGTPVMAPDAPPFDETVADGITGLRYRDPREDGGRDFEAKLARLTSGAFRFDREAAREHLELFSEQAFAARVQRLLDRLAAAS